MHFERATLALALIAILATSTEAGETQAPRSVDPWLGLTFPTIEGSFLGSPDAVALLDMSPNRLPSWCRRRLGSASADARPATPRGRRPARLVDQDASHSHLQEVRGDLPQRQDPCQVDKKVPEEAVEVVPGVFHHYRTT